MPLFAYIAAEAPAYLLWSVVASTDIGFELGIFWHGATDIDRLSTDILWLWSQQELIMYRVLVALYAVHHQVSFVS